MPTKHDPQPEEKKPNRNLKAIKFDITETLRQIKAGEALSSAANAAPIARLTVLGGELHDGYDFIHMQEIYRWMRDVVFQHRGLDSPIAALDTAWEGIEGWQA